MRYAVRWVEPHGPEAGESREEYFETMGIAESVAARMRDTMWAYSYRRVESYQEILDFMHGLHGRDFRLERMFHQLHSGLRLWKETGDWYHENLVGAPEEVSRYWTGNAPESFEFVPGDHLNAEETIYLAQYLFGAECTGVWDEQGLNALGGFFGERALKFSEAMVWNDLTRYRHGLEGHSCLPQEYLDARDARVSRELAQLRDQFPIFTWEQGGECYRGMSENKYFRVQGFGPPNLRNWKAAIGASELTAISWEVCQGSFKEVLATLKEHLEMMTQWLS